MGATIKDIARKLNISVSTVSYALNGGPRSVPEEVKKRVFEAARELDYRPNRLAKSLVSGKSDTIGVAFDRITPNLLLSPFRNTILNTLFNVLEEMSYDALLLTSVQGELGRPSITKMVDGRVDGIVILSPLISEEVLQALDQREFPYVTIAAGKNRSASDYSIDNARGIELSVRHLVELGHRKIGFVAGLWEHSDAIEREKAFRTAMRSLELPLPEAWVRPGDFTLGGGERAAREILTLSTRPTALVCANDESAWGVVTIAKKLGLDIPKELSVTGFDDLPLSSRMDPSLTTVRQPLETMVQGAVAGLMALIEGRSAPSRQFEPALIARGSTSRPPEDIYP